MEPRPPAEEIDACLQENADHTVDNVGLGLFYLIDPVDRDRLVRQHVVLFGEGRMLSFAKHDEGITSEPPLILEKAGSCF